MYVAAWRACLRDNVAAWSRLYVCQARVAQDNMALLKQHDFVRALGQISPGNVDVHVVPNP